MNHVITGGCVCGGVRFEVRGTLRDVISCHLCSVPTHQRTFRRRTACRRPAFKLLNNVTLKWYVAVPGFRCGSCRECGSSLFFEKDGAERVSTAAGSLNAPQGLKIVAQIFVSEAGDYYQIDACVPVSKRGDHIVTLP
jgi:hypothetical protein